MNLKRDTKECVENQGGKVGEKVGGGGGGG